MASLGTSDISAALKEKYLDGLPEKQLYEDSPFMAMVRKDRESLASRQVHIPAKYARPQGASATFATGRTNMAASKFKGFDVTPKNYFAFAQIDNEVIARAKAKGDGSHIVEADDEIQGALYTLGRQAARLFYGNGGGSIGQISATSDVTTATITLADPTMIRFYEVGMVLKSSATDGTSGSVRAGSVTISAVNREEGTLTASGNWNAGITSPAASDYLFREGDFGLVMSGVEAWVPRTAPSATTFFGVDRSVDSRLGGIRGDFSAYGVEEACTRAVERLIRESSKCDFGVLGSTDYMNLELSARSRIQPTTVKSYEDDGLVFDAIKVGLAGRRVTIVMDPDAPAGRFICGELGTWTLGSLGKSLCDFNNPDGMEILRTVTADSVEAQLVMRSQLWCTAPGKNGNFKVSSAG